MNLEQAAAILREEYAKPKSDPSRQYEAARADLIRVALQSTEITDSPRGGGRQFDRSPNEGPSVPEGGGQ